MSWKVPAPKWDSVAGRVLDDFLEAVHLEMPDYCEPVTVIGSAAIQLCLDEGFASADVDVMVLSDAQRLRDLASRPRASRGGTRPAYGLQVCPPQLFKTTPHYLQRAHFDERHGLKVIVPHVRDILVAKLHRFRVEGQEGLVIKDSRAFSRVRELCGGRPSAEDMIEDLRYCEADFRVPQDGGVNSFRLNVLELFATHYGRQLDVEREIVRPSRLAEEHGVYAASAIAAMLEQLEPDRD